MSPTVISAGVCESPGCRIHFGGCSGVSAPFLKANRWWLGPWQQLSASSAPPQSMRPQWPQAFSKPRYAGARSHADAHIVRAPRVFQSKRGQTVAQGTGGVVASAVSRALPRWGGGGAMGVGPQVQHCYCCGFVCQNLSNGACTQVCKFITPSFTIFPGPQWGCCGRALLDGGHWSNTEHSMPCDELW